MEQRIKNENKKAFGKFIIIIAAAAILGFLVGLLSNRTADGMKQFLFTVIPALLTIIEPYALIACSVLLLGTGTLIYIQCKKSVKNSQEDEVLDQAEEKLNYPLLLASICMILDFFFFSVSMIYCAEWKDILWRIIFFAISIGLTVLLQQKVVDLVKTINPEKKGSVYDTKFGKKWVDSCDEAQQLGIYKAAYAAYQVTTTTCIFLWVILQLSSMFIGTGILPIAIVILIWLVSNISYCIASIRLERNKQ